MLNRRMMMQMGAAAQDGIIWLFRNGAFDPAAGAFVGRGPNAANNQSFDTLIPLTIADDIRFGFSLNNYNAVRTITTQNPVQGVAGKTLHAKAYFKAKDSRVRQTTVWVYACTGVTDTDVMPAADELDNYFENPAKQGFVIQWKSGNEYEVEYEIPIVYPTVYVSIVIEKRYIFADYVRFTEVWIE